MLYEILEWLHLTNQLDHQKILVLNQRPSDLIILLYIISFKRSWLFAAAFFACDGLVFVNFFDVFDGLSHDRYGMAFYLTLALVWSVTIKSHINHTKNASLAFWCSTMILFLLYMAWDSLINATIQTYAYTNYESIVVFIHVCIVLSLYKPRTIINSLVHKFCSYGRHILHYHSVQFICYNVMQCKIKRRKK